MTRAESWIFAVITAVALAVCVFFVVTLADAAVKIAVALVAVVGGIVAAIVKHGFDLERERRHAEFLAKQKNYSELLATIGNFAREKEGAYDALCSAHLASWAFGDKDVILSTNALLANPGQAALVALLVAIRTSLNDRASATAILSDPPSLESKYDSALLFSPRTSKGFK